MNLEKLKTLFEKRVIPEKPRSATTFLGIAKQPHYENVISNIYAFYFDTEAEHGFDDLFIKSLVQCINKKIDTSKIIQSNEYEVDTEVKTNDGGRIDILLRSEDSAIVIENKIHHHLSNNLNDYWNSALEELNDTSNSIGVVLCLIKVETDNDNFIVITHNELLKQVNKNLGDYHIEANPKYLTFLQDFQLNLFNQSKRIMTEQELKTYLENKEQIDEAIYLKEKYKDKLYEQVKAIEFEPFNKPKIVERNTKHPKKGTQYYKKISLFISKKNDYLRLHISYGKLSSKENYLKIRIDLRNLKDEEKYKTVLSKVDQKRLKPDSKEEKENKVLAVKKYHPSVEDKMNLTKYISRKIDEDGFVDVFKSAENILSQLEDK